MSTGAKIFSQSCCMGTGGSDPLWATQFLADFLVDVIFWQCWAWQAPPIPPWCPIIHFILTHCLLCAVSLWGTACPGTETLLARETKALRCENWDSQEPPCPKNGPLPWQGWPCLAEEALDMDLLQEKSTRGILCSKPVLAWPRRKSGIPKFSVSNRNCLSLGFYRQKHCWNQTFFGIYWHY